MAKLTYYDKWLGKYLAHKGTTVTEILTKLGRLEELEAAGRLVILPEGFEMEDAQKLIIGEYCPSDFGLEDRETCLTCGEPKHKKCKACWEAAMKGGGVDEQI